MAVLLLVLGGIWGLQPVAGQPPPGGKPARQFLVEPHNSEITVLLYKKGLLSGFAHDHVLVSNELAGEILLINEDDLHATARLTLPVESFQVDRPEHRKREQFTGDLSEADRREIRETMLGPDQMHGAKHSHITAVVERVEGSWPMITARARIRIRDVEKQFAIPLKAELMGDMLRVSGGFQGRHSDFSIEPFSSYLGAVAVEDNFVVRLQIQAREMP